MKIQYQVGMILLKKQRNDNNEFCFEKQKEFQLLKPLTKWPPIWGGGEGGVPHGNYVAQLDLEKSTTYYSCMFVTPIESTTS
jgi:hypothetical protein